MHGRKCAIVSRRVIFHGFIRFSINRPQDACAIAMEALRDTNKFLTEEEPWMHKKPEEKPRNLETVRVCLEAVYGVAHFLVAFIPTSCSRVFEKMGKPVVL